MILYFSFCVQITFFFFPGVAWSVNQSSPATEPGGYEGVVEEVDANGKKKLVSC